MSGRYIVVFKDSASQDEIQKYADDVKTNGGEVNKHFDTLLKGFSANIPDSFLTQLQSLGPSGPIDYIEPDQVVTVQ